VLLGNRSAASASDFCWFAGPSAASRFSGSFASRGGLPAGRNRAPGPRRDPHWGGNPGFDITVTRTRKHDGKALPDDVLTTKYGGDVDVICN